MHRFLKRPEILLVLTYVVAVTILTHIVDRGLAVFITLPSSLFLILDVSPQLVALLDITDRYLPLLNYSIATLLFSLINAGLLYRVRNYVLARENGILNLQSSIRHSIVLIIAVLGLSAVLVGVLIFWSLRSADGPPNKKIGERTFYQDSDMELKIGLHFSDIGISYQGNDTIVSCQSKNTLGFPGVVLQSDVTIDEGWAEVPKVLFEDKRSKSIYFLEFLADEARKRHLVQDNMTLAVIQDRGIAVSFDGCGSFSHWDASQELSDEEFIKVLPEFDACLDEDRKESDVYPNGKVINDTWVPATDEPYYNTFEDCASHRWYFERTPTISNVIAKRNGTASFELTSPTLRENKALHVRTTDAGETWTYNVVDVK